MKRQTLAAALLFTSLCAFARAAVDSARSSPQSPAQVLRDRQHPAATDPGEQIFASNCARCHTPPMTLPQRITGTVIMHMRVRARLSRQDEKLLLHYMAP